MIGREELAIILAEMIVDYTVPAHLYGEPRDAAISIWTGRILFKLSGVDLPAEQETGENAINVSRSPFNAKTLEQRVSMLETRVYCGNGNPLWVFQKSGVRDWHCDVYGANECGSMNADTPEDAAVEFCKMLIRATSNPPLKREWLIYIRPLINGEPLENIDSATLYRVIRDEYGAYHVHFEG